MQTFEHKKINFLQSEFVPTKFPFTQFWDFLIFLVDYLIGLAIMNDNTDEEH
jgi:hypothetical protein